MVYNSCQFSAFQSCCALYKVIASLVTDFYTSLCGINDVPALCSRRLSSEETGDVGGAGDRGPASNPSYAFPSRLVRELATKELFSSAQSIADVFANCSCLFPNDLCHTRQNPAKIIIMFTYVTRLTNHTHVQRAHTAYRARARARP